MLRRALHFEVDGQRRRWGPKRAWKKQVEEEESMQVGKMRFAGQRGVLALIRLPLGLGASGHPHLLGYYQILHIAVSHSTQQVDSFLHLSIYWHMSNFLCLFFYLVQYYLWKFFVLITPLISVSVMFCLCLVCT